MQLIDGLIFDLDGTLWDASSACSQAWNAAFRQLGHESCRFDEATIRSFSGMRIESIFNHHLSFLTAEAQHELLALYKIKEMEFLHQYGGRLYPQVKEILPVLKKHYPLFIVSNCLSGYIENFLSFSGLEALFTDFESSGNSGLPKAENIRLVRERNGLQHPVYIGDTKWDQDAAQKAGVPFVYAAYGFGDVKSSEWQLSGFDDLLNLLPGIAPARPVV